MGAPRQSSWFATALHVCDVFCCYLIGPIRNITSEEFDVMAANLAPPAALRRKFRRILVARARAGIN